MADERLPPPSPRPGRHAAGRSLPARLVGRVTGLERVVGGLVAALMLVLVVIEPDILEAPVENATTLLFTVGGTIGAAALLVAMLRFEVPAVVRVVALWVPFAVVSWWLISPYFLDDVVDDEFSTSIDTQLAEGGDPAGPDAPVPAPPVAEPPVAEPPVPVLVGAGRFVGLAGHSGTGDAGIFRSADGSYVLRFENFDIENGPDLEVYLVPGADQTSLAAGSIHLGALRGNVGDQTYDLPPGTALGPGAYTALVWCEAFSVEFVGATLTVG